MKVGHTIFLIFLYLITLSIQIYAQDILGHLHLSKYLARPNFPSYTHNSKLLIDPYRILNFPHSSAHRQNRGIIIDSALFLSTYGRNKVTYEYDNNSRISSFIWKNFYQNKWSNITKAIDTYDSLGNLILELSSSWYLDHWKEDFRETFTYDSDQNLITDLWEVIKNSHWSNSSRFTHQYYPNGNLFSLLSEHWDSTGWNNDDRETIFYNTSGDRDSIFLEKWVDGKWTNDLIWNLVYENHKTITSYLAKIWNGNQWIISDRGDFKYNSNGDWVYGLYQIWDQNQWMDACRFYYEYNSNNYFNHGLNERYNYGVWTPDDNIFEVSRPDLRINIISSELYVYYKTSSVLDEVFDKSELIISQNYPNPFNSTTVINFSIPEDGFVQLKVFDIMGEEIKTILNEYKSRGNYKVYFYADKLPSGVYIYQIISGSYNKSKTMILQK
jgi:hypothetical protein